MCPWRVCFVLLALGASAAHGADYVAMSGKELYMRFCASCHGESGRGDGPVAASLTVETPDLTLLARRRGGKFPRELVERIIDGRHIIGAHGARTMPVWGEEFGRAELGGPDTERATEVIVTRLADYVAQLQRPEEGPLAKIAKTAKSRSRPFGRGYRLEAVGWR